jgi:hypothetical protein
LPGRRNLAAVARLHGAKILAEGNILSWVFREHASMLMRCDAGAPDVRSFPVS